ncbi:glycoside hydrolase superfamily [Gongronella butleri]|nr:glycoside hydrolase superfamily [Gongronella butleri]
MKSLLFAVATLVNAYLAAAAPAPQWAAIHGHKEQPKSVNGTASPSIAPLSATSFDPSGPKFVTYIDGTSGNSGGAAFAVPGTVPDNDYNVIILGFWLDSGLYDSGYTWSMLDDTTRQGYIDAIHGAGKKILISAFGAAEAPTSAGVDPATSAKNLAGIVKKYGFDGADIDWEDNNAMDGGTGEAWLITFQNMLRAELPSGQYLISHAPQAPYFIINKTQYPNGAYQAVHKAVGSSIDWYNTQFYNQGSSSYDTCDTLLHTSGGAFPGTSLFEIIATGVDSSKLLIGKPATAAGATNTGYMDPSSLATCISQAKSSGWDAGIMLWQFTLDSNGAIINQLAGAM